MAEIRSLEDLARFLGELVADRRYTAAELGRPDLFTPPRQFVFPATTTPELAFEANAQRSEFIIENPSENTDRVEWGDENLVIGAGLRVPAGGVVSKTGWKGRIYIVAASGIQRVIVREESTR